MAELLAEGTGIFELIERSQEFDSALAEGDIGQVRIYGPVEVPDELLGMIYDAGETFGVHWHERPRAEGNMLVLTVVKQSPVFVAIAATLRFIISNALVVAIAFLVASFSFQLLKLDPREAVNIMTVLTIGIVAVAGMMLWKFIQTPKPSVQQRYLDW